MTDKSAAAMMTEDDIKSKLDCDQNYNILCHPEDMRRETLLSILEERQLDIPDLDEMGLVDLIQIYNSYLLPLPQREHKQQSTIKIEADNLSTTFKRKALISDCKDDSKKMRRDAEIEPGVDL